ncbi:hypothetical protein H1R20_g543, partial [Candolleomyces eurysporus]
MTQIDTQLSNSSSRMTTVKDNSDVDFGLIVNLREYQKHLPVGYVGSASSVMKTTVNRAKRLD